MTYACCQEHDAKIDRLTAALETAGARAEQAEAATRAWEAIAGANADARDRERDAERERCAQIADKMPRGGSFSEEYERGHDDACSRIAACIRDPSRHLLAATPRAFEQNAREDTR